jgi:hypothetical protein
MKRFAGHVLAGALSAALTVSFVGPGRSQENKVYTDPKKVDADYAFQGEYQGMLPGREGTQKLAVQVIALGNGKFEAAVYKGGLPGDGWNGEEVLRLPGEREGDGVVIRGDEGRGVIGDGSITAYNASGEKVGELQKVHRESPTSGMQPPDNAVVLFNGESTDAWKNGKMTEEGLLMPGTTSVPTFGSHQLHVEFLLPYMPEARGQARGNSGVYLQGRYEVQMLDSFGLEGKHNECGGIYSVKDPAVNACLPPLVWQTYDIDYRAAKYDGDGKLVENPRITVKHNGILIHDNVELPGDRVTTAAPAKVGPEPGPVYLQDHGNPVRYRNVWVVQRE